MVNTAGMSEWRVEVVWDLGEEPLGDDRLLELTKALDSERGWFAARWADGNGIEVSSYEQARTGADAIMQFAGEVRAWMIRRGLTGTVPSVRACAEWVYAREVDKPSG